MSHERILIAPLNWGLGHATRIIPIIKELLDMDKEVVIAASGRSLTLLRNEFPNLEFIDFPDYNMKYSGYISPVLKIILMFPLLLYKIRRERLLLKKIIKKYEIDYIISDNRYGLFHPNIPSVFISHQILIKPPRFLSFTEIVIWWLVTGRSQKFTYTWIPDCDTEPNLSGELSHKYPIPYNGRFIGILSSLPETKPEKCDVLIMISGPEPLRTEMENIVRRETREVKGKKIVVILGLPQKNNNEGVEKTGNNIFYRHLSRERISSLMRGAELIISRPGYTTVMEVASLGKRAFWIPTPGQTEQEYLAKYYKKKKWYGFSSQKNFNLLSAISESSEYFPPKIKMDRELLRKNILELLS